MKHELDRDRFATAVGSKFTLRAAEEKSLEIELVEVSPLRERAPQVSYSLLFMAPENCTVDQGMYEVEHADLGAMQLFLVPVGIANQRLQLEAVFNLLRSDESTTTE